MKECLYCHQEHSVGRIFCSRNCANKYNGNNLSVKRIGKGNPMYGRRPWNYNIKKTEEQKMKHSKRIKLLYEQGVQMGFRKGNRTKSQFREGHLGMCGSKNPAWCDGKSFEPYGLDWTIKKKNKIKERDNYQCQRCYKQILQKVNPKDKKGQDWLTIHHIDYDKKNCSSDNLITLCHKCNCSVNANRSYWTNYFQLKVQQEILLVNN